MLTNRREFQAYAIALIKGLEDPSTVITDRKLSMKLLKIKRWYKPIAEEHDDQLKAMHEKHVAPENFKVDNLGYFESGDKEKFKEYIEDNNKFLDEEIPALDIKINDSELEGSTISFRLLSLMDDAGILEGE